MALQSQTYANSGNAYYGNPADWSKYSTLTSTILFNDTNATLKSIPAIPDTNTTLEFNGNQLAYVSDIPDLANWAQYPANHDVDVPKPFYVNANEGVISPLLKNTAIAIVADEPSIFGISPNIDIIAQGGPVGGSVIVVAEPAVGGIGGNGTITMTANGGSGLLGTNGFIGLTANPGDSSVVGVTSGGAINITANSGVNDDINLTSAVKVSAAGVNIQSGITSPIVSVAGYTFIGGNSGVNICGGIPPIIPNVPGTTYIYGTTGIELNSDVYTTNVFPYWSGATPVVDDLNISGRPAGLLNNEAYLNLGLVSTISGKEIDFQAVSSINISSSVVTLNNVSTINNAPYPPPSAWNGTATTDLNMNNFNITSTNTISFKENPSGTFAPPGFRSAYTPPGNFSLIEAFDANSTTNPPRIKSMRALTLHLSYGTEAIPPTSYLDDLFIYNASANGRIGVDQYSQSSPFVSSFTLATRLDPNTPLDLYVSPNGVDNIANNTQGHGRLLNPFQTIAFAIGQRNTYYPLNQEVVIHVAPGTYTENFTVPRNTFIVGISTGEQSQPCNIVGTITMSDTTGNMGLSGLQITPINTDGVIIGGAGGIYTIYNCNILGGTSNSIEIQQGTVFITECRIVSNNTTGAVNPAIAIQSGATVTIRDCNISNQPLNPSAVITCNGTLTLRQSIIQSLNTTSTTLQALIVFSGSANKLIEISNCNITYANTLTDTGTNKCCIQFSNSSGTYTVSMFSCLLLCEGATTGGGTIDCIQDIGAGAVNLSYGLLRAGATAHHIASTINKTEYTAVP
jgi:hypothetical protein